MTVKSPVEELTTLFKELDEYMNGLRQSRLALIVANKLDAADEGQLKLLDLIEWLAKEKIEVSCTFAVGGRLGSAKLRIFLTASRQFRPTDWTQLAYGFTFVRLRLMFALAPRVWEEEWMKSNRFCLSCCKGPVDHAES
mmetsp:Transcript_11146/g.46531  ORF Transcript_11146/g.46531 Transcript_11146/m.46531 type:complete len:139 (-) Transcript_11146:227-643(-)